MPSAVYDRKRTDPSESQELIPSSKSEAPAKPGKTVRYSISGISVPVKQFSDRFVKSQFFQDPDAEPFEPEQESSHRVDPVPENDIAQIAPVRHLTALPLPHEGDQFPQYRVFMNSFERIGDSGFCDTNGWRNGGSSEYQDAPGVRRSYG